MKDEDGKGVVRKEGSDKRAKGQGPSLNWGKK